MGNFLWLWKEEEEAENFIAEVGLVTEMIVKYQFSEIVKL